MGLSRLHYHWLMSRVILHCDVTAGHTLIYVLGCSCQCSTMVLQLEGCIVDTNCVHIGSLHHEGTEWAFINSWAWPWQMDWAQDGQTVQIQAVTYNHNHVIVKCIRKEVSVRFWSQRLGACSAQELSGYKFHRIHWLPFLNILHIKNYKQHVQA